MKRFTIAAAALAFSAGSAIAADPSGTWKTAPNDEGAYLLVDVAPCGDKVCGHIKGAVSGDGTDNTGYEHTGKQMIFDMSPDGENKWDDGEIWAPDDDKRYNANMELKGDVLVVEGCVFFICRAQDWTRAN